tara:strand:- start:216 stop:581 length:366 start_codon:yes stop_codon:yes gene_type:complete
MKLVTSPNLEVRESPVHGWGVFALRRIPKGEIVEESPIFKTSLKGDKVSGSPLNRYFWTSPGGSGYILTFGLASIFNNKTDNHNVMMEWYIKQRFFRFTAIKDIEKDEELFINYTQYLTRS